MSWTKTKKKKSRRSERESEEKKKQTEEKNCVIENIIWLLKVWKNVATEEGPTSKQNKTKIFARIACESSESTTSMEKRTYMDAKRWHMCAKSITPYKTIAWGLENSRNVYFNFSLTILSVCGLNICLFDSIYCCKYIRLYVLANSSIKVS